MKTRTTSSMLIALVLVCLAFSPTARAVLPPPDGGYPGGNTAEGEGALFRLITGTANTAIGFDALYNNITGNDNTATGRSALFSNITGNDNTATGQSALFSNTNGNFNTANGDRALASNTTGDGNTAIGFFALFSNIGERNNTAVGWEALLNNTGLENTATGAAALLTNTVGSFNTANGVYALTNNRIGFRNAATGSGALFNNTEGSFNTANGARALFNNTTGSSNIALGIGAGEALTTGSHNIDIGNAGVAAEADTIRIGTRGTQTKTYIAAIYGTSLGRGVPVRVNEFGQLGTVASSARFKQNIKPMDKTSEAIFALQPVTFRYKEQIDPDRIPQFGLIAEEVEKVNPDLVVRDADGKINGVRYEQVNAMLLNEFLKEHKTVQEQGATIARLQKQVEALTAGLQKVSAQMELTKPALQTVLNNQ